MASLGATDAQFDRAVEIVQGLPKTGPIQTDYEEKLTMYSLYKQATVGNVKTPRPGIWDMLGRAKWDAWAKHRDLDSYEAKWLYVDALLRVLRKYSDKTVAKTLIEELESYGHYASVLRSQSHYRSTDSDTSSSATSDDEPYEHPIQSLGDQPQGGGTLLEENDFEDDVARELTLPPENEQDLSQLQANRPPSSLSSYRYRTPLAMSIATSPPPSHTVPTSQPLPNFETPSAFVESSPAASPSHPTMSSYADLSEPSRVEVATPTHQRPLNQQYHGSQPRALYNNSRPTSRLELERAVENVQVHLAALNERLDTLEAVMALSRSNVSLSPRYMGSPRGRGSPHASPNPQWDLDDFGMWSIILSPISRGAEKLRGLASFFARNEDRSPSAIIIRRLCLDVSFFVCVLMIVKVLWRRSGVRRQEVRFALKVLWRAIVGAKPERIMMHRGT